MVRSALPRKGGAMPAEGRGIRALWMIWTLGFLLFFIAVLFVLIVGEAPERPFPEIDGVAETDR